MSATTSLIAPAGQGRLDLLCACFEQVRFPDALSAEWLAGDPIVLERLQECGFLRIDTVTDTPSVAQLERLLNRGEAEALAPAKTQGLPPLVDEKKGRSVAHMMSVPVPGLVGMLILAAERRHLAVAEAEQILIGARAASIRVADRLVASFQSRLRQVQDPE